jgi:glucuronokinase
MIIKTHSYPRAALIGNPSDGYFGKTIAFVFDNFKAEVTLFESPELEIIPAQYDTNVFMGMKALADDVKLYGYYGGIRLLKAAVKRFYDYCVSKNYVIKEKNFTIRYKSNIPFRLGLAGSSAIITACMKALMQFYNVQIQEPVLANLVLSVESEELKISAGLQDRVVQAYECPVYMDFNKELMRKQGYGRYEKLEKQLFPPIYIAYDADLSEGSEMVHNNFRERYNFGDEKVLKAIAEWSFLTDKVKKMLMSGDKNHIGPLLNRNFDIRKEIMNISHKNLLMVNTARSTGASAKFTGSGGAIIGTYTGESMYNDLEKALKPIGVKIIKPDIVGNNA